MIRINFRKFVHDRMWAGWFWCYAPGVTGRCDWSWQRAHKMFHRPLVQRIDIAFENAANASDAKLARPK